MTRLSLQKYKQTTRSTAETASPYELVGMLFQQLLTNIASAKGAIQQNDPAQKGELISKAITIISVLEGSLDFEKGGEISQNLAALYQFSSEKLVEANTNNDTELLDKILEILLPIKAGWDGIPQEHRQAVSF